MAGFLEIRLQNARDSGKLNWRNFRRSGGRLQSPHRFGVVRWSGARIRQRQVERALSSKLRVVFNVMVGAMKTLLCLLSVALLAATAANAQDACTCYQVVPQVQYRPQPVTEYKLVEETVYEKQQQTSYKPVWKTERRERRTIVRKPVYETSERVEEETVMKKIVETVYEEKRFEETLLENVTEIQDREVVVETPVTETSYREQATKVLKPVTETVNQSENVTVYRPQTVAEQAYATTLIPNSQWVLQDGGYGRSRLQYVPSGYYPDPATGVVSYYRGGFRWVPTQRPDSYQLQTTQTPVVTPYTVERTTLIPETVTVQRPVQTTRYVEEVVTERIPVTTQTTRREVVTQKVPVVVQRPSKRIVTEKVPVEKVRYVPYVVTKKTPITKVTYIDEEQVEPYDVQVLTYVAETSEVQVPKRVRRWVPITTTHLVPETQFVPRVIAESTTGPAAVPRVESGATMTEAARVPSTPEPQVFYGTPVVTERPAESVLVGETSVAKPATELTDVDSPSPPAVEDNRSGSDDVGDPSKSETAPKTPEKPQEADKVPELSQG